PLGDGHACDRARALAFSSGSRDTPAAGISSRMREVAERARLHHPRILFKKIDSTLRGNTALELIAARDAFGYDAVVVNPAFPAMGRIVEAGVLRITTDCAFRPIGIGAWLAAH